MTGAVILTKAAKEQVTKVNMTSLGIRVTPKEVYYAITKLEEGKAVLLVCDVVKVPPALEIPEQLKFLRDTFLDIIYENEVKTACIRVVETNAQSYDYHRLYIEGVLQEMIASSTIERYYLGRIASISNRIGIDRKDFSNLLSSNECPFIAEWDTTKSKEKREAMLASYSAINL